MRKGRRAGWRQQLKRIVKAYHEHGDFDPAVFGEPLRGASPQSISAPSSSAGDRGPCASSTVEPGACTFNQEFNKFKLLDNLIKEQDWILPKCPDINENFENIDKSELLLKKRTISQNETVTNIIQPTMQNTENSAKIGENMKWKEFALYEPNSSLQEFETKEVLQQNSPLSNDIHENYSSKSFSSSKYSIEHSDYLYDVFCNKSQNIENLLKVGENIKQTKWREFEQILRGSESSVQDFDKGIEILQQKRESSNDNYENSSIENSISSKCSTVYLEDNVLSNKSQSIENLVKVGKNTNKIMSKEFDQMLALCKSKSSLLNKEISEIEQDIQDRQLFNKKTSSLQKSKKMEILQRKKLLLNKQDILQREIQLNDNYESSLIDDFSSSKCLTVHLEDDALSIKSQNIENLVKVGEKMNDIFLQTSKLIHELDDTIKFENIKTESKSYMLMLCLECHQKYKELADVRNILQKNIHRLKCEKKIQHDIMQDIIKEKAKMERTLKDIDKKKTTLQLKNSYLEDMLFWTEKENKDLRIRLQKYDDIFTK